MTVDYFWFIDTFRDFISSAYCTIHEYGRCGMSVAGLLYWPQFIRTSSLISEKTRDITTPANTGPYHRCQYRLMNAKGISPIPNTKWWTCVFGTPFDPPNALVEILCSTESGGGCGVLLTLIFQSLKSMYNRSLTESARARIRMYDTQPVIRNNSRSVNLGTSKSFKSDWVDKGSEGYA